LKIDFPYPGYEKIAPVEVPDDNLMGVFSPKTFDTDETAVLRQGIERPIGAPRLREMVRQGQRVLILIDDGTRMTPVAKFSPTFSTSSTPAASPTITSNSSRLPALIAR
jgi:hypothetical protein